MHADTSRRQKYTTITIHRDDYYFTLRWGVSAYRLSSMPSEEKSGRDCNRTALRLPVDRRPRGNEAALHERGPGLAQAAGSPGKMIYGREADSCRGADCGRGATAKKNRRVGARSTRDIRSEAHKRFESNYSISVLAQRTLFVMHCRVAVPRSVTVTGWWQHRSDRWCRCNNVLVVRRQRRWPVAGAGTVRPKEKGPRTACPVSRRSAPAKQAFHRA
jgi:hypothetical protein